MNDEVKERMDAMKITEKKILKKVAPHSTPLYSCEQMTLPISSLTGPSAATTITYTDAIKGN